MQVGGEIIYARCLRHYKGHYRTEVIRLQVAARLASEVIRVQNGGYN